jgi:hypothetical protein
MESTQTTMAPPDSSFVTHTDTRHLRWATVFSALIAFCKNRDELIPSDLLAGIYVANWERVSKFWPQPELFEDFIAEHCDWSEPRWHTWQRWHEESRRAPRSSRFQFRYLHRGKLKQFGKPRLFGSHFSESPDLKRLFETGERLTPYKVPERGRNLPLLTPEIMLLAFVRTDGIPLGRHLQDNGLMVDKLDEAANRHIENPEKLMF